MNPGEDRQFEGLVGRTFAFFPAIRSFEHNEWTLEKQTWSEVLVKNKRTAEEIWIPRSHIGKIATSDSPIMIVGLLKELQYKAGAVVPYRPQVVPMPSPVSAARGRIDDEPEPAVPRRGSSVADTQTFSFIAKAVLAALSVVVLFVMFSFSKGDNPMAALFRADSSTTDQLYVGLTNSDSYRSVVARVGRPKAERWLHPEEADLQIQVLRYPNRRYVVILMGGTRVDVRYVGTLHDPSRRILDAARLSRGGDTASLLRNLPEF